MNKYQEALNELVDTALYYHDCITGNEFDNAQNLIQELIDMHSHPLKLKEIEEGMWVWDNLVNDYFKVVKVLGDKFMCQAIESSPLTVRFYEINRFYRYQPLED